MTLDVHHPSSADVDPLGDGLSDRRCRRRTSEGDEDQKFHDVFHGYSPSIHLVRCPAKSTNRIRSFLIGKASESLMQINSGGSCFHYEANRAAHAILKNLGGDFAAWLSSSSE